jgi:Tol biopolymer transport system component
MPISAGRSLAHYRLIAPIGEGAMGTVWRARDTRLDRDVAVKFILPEFVADAGRRVRFEREAKLLATLNHPNVESIYGLELYRESGQELPALILELISGESLSERVARGPIPTSDALALAGQLLEGLIAAHEAGIVHRDLKPENVRVTPGGVVKILDFGIATSAGPPGIDTASSATRTAATLAGAIVGTPGYMSPEQARGQALDARSDLWSFGCIVFEMLSAQPAFGGPTLSDTIVAVLTRDPDVSQLPAETPEAVTDLLTRCLAKTAGDRPASAREAKSLLDAARQPESVTGADAPIPRLTQETFGDAIDGFPVWSPDGTELVYAAGAGRVRKLVRMRAGSGEPVPLTQGDADDIMPAWSPDGGTILFVRGRKSGTRLQPGDVYGEYADADVWAIELASGKETIWAESAFNPSYSPDGRTVAVDASRAGPRRIWQFDARGRNPVQISTDVSEAVSHTRPRFSPDGKTIVFQAQERTRFNVGTVGLASRKPARLTNDLWSDLNPVWSPSGRFVYFSSYRSGGLNIWRIPVAPDGTARGAARQVTTGAGQDVEIAIGPGGRKLAFTILKQNSALFSLPVAADTGKPTGAPRRLMAASRDDSRGAWSPDGGTIAFNSPRSGTMNVWALDVGTGRARALTSGPGGDYQPTWSPDGKTLVFFSSRAGSPGIWAVDVASGRLDRLSTEGGIEINPFYSPDGRHIAYQSDRDGRLEVWVMRADGGEPRQLTRCGVSGHFLRWTQDGRHVIFRCPAAGATLRVALDGGEPEGLGTIAGGAHMSLSPDESKIMDVVAHKVLWVSTIRGDSSEPIFEFDDPDARIDYPVWSPDGRQVVLDRFRPQGGEIWTLDGVE